MLLGGGIKVIRNRISYRTRLFNVMGKVKDREPDYWDSFPPEMRKLVETIRRRGSDALDDMQRMLVVQIFRTAAMTREPRVIFIRNKIQEAHLEYCFRLPAVFR